MLIEEFDRSRHNRDRVKELLSMAVGNPTSEKLAQLLDEFYTADGHTIYLALDNGNIAGLIGIDHTDKPRGFITHLAVLPDRRRQRIGSSLISHTAELLELSDITVETDQDAVDFYTACGFIAIEIESRYPEIRRFRCYRNMVE